MEQALSALDAESSGLLADSPRQPPELVWLRLIKARTNVARTRQALLKDADLDARLLDIEDRLLSTELEVSARGPAEPERGSPRPAPPPAKPESVLDELFSLSTDGMRQRRPKVDKMEVSQYQQEQLSSDLVDMAAAIKRNAQLFQEKLDKDGDLVAATGDAMHATSGSMSSVGSRLAQYRRETQLGWMFYIYSGLFIMLALVFGMLLIQVFGKW